MTLLGVTKPLTLTISRVVCAQHPFYKKEDCGAEVSGTLRRSEFGMTKYVPAGGDEVTLHIQVEALKERVSSHEREAHEIGDCARPISLPRW